MSNRRKVTGSVSAGRRKVLGGLAAASGLVALGTERVALAGSGGGNDLIFPGQRPHNFVVFQFNKADPSYQEHVLFSVSAVLRKFGDDVRIVVTAFGPGIHILLKKPLRPVSKFIRDSVSSLNDYGVEFHACGNTLKALKLTKAAILPFAKYVDSGAVDLMELQKRGYAYISL
ncbi:MAG: DsrE family protein [Gammaproteobacteria bacterium]|nr:DsrE family protein [Gammaproteobacteria bacterium]